MPRLASALALLATLATATVEARALPSYRIDATLDRDARTIAGTMALTVENDGAAPLDELELWLFPNRLARPSPALDDHNFYWVYPRRFDGGAIAVSPVTVDGAPAASRIEDGAPSGPRTILVVTLPRPLAPGARATVSLAFTTRIPTRFGSFGCYKGACTLSGGFHPTLLARTPDGNAWDRTAPPAVADHDLTLRAPAPADLVVAGARCPSSTSCRATIAATLGPLACAGPPGRYAERAVTHRGVTLRYLAPGADRPSPPEPPRGRAMPYLVEDYPALVLDAARDAVDLLAAEGLALPDGTTLTMVDTPLRMELAVPSGGAALVSDRLFRILPLARFRKFHAFQLARALFAVAAEERLARTERADDLGWAPDVAASWLVDRYTIRGFGGPEFARDLLGGVAFIPQIDKLLYAPQIEFPDAYFNTVDEPDPTRDDLRRFASDRPRGKLLHEKLRDRLGDDGAAEVAHLQWEGRPIRQAARAIAQRREKGPIDDLFSTWLGPYPAIDYRFSVAEPEPLPDGRLRHRIRVYKVSAGERPTAIPHEPVELRATEWGGERHDLTWSGAGTEATLVVDTRRRLRLVELDPRGRLVERLPDVSFDPRLDDRQPARVKFIYNNFGAIVDLQSLTLDLSLDFTLSRVFDVRNSLRFLAWRDTATQVGLLAAYTRSFGPLITPARLAGFVSTTLRAARLEPSFGRAGMPPLPGTQLAFSVAVGWDDRFFVWEPTRYFGASAQLTYVLTAQDSGRVFQQATASATVERSWPIVRGQTFAALLNLAGTFGDLQVPSQMLAAGAPSWLRGYTPDELLGRLRTVGRVEWRHTFVHDLDWNFLHFMYIRGLAGALFAEGAAISPCDSYAVSSRDLFGDIGYSFRVLSDWFGVSQTMLHVDIAVPITRGGTTSASGVRRSRGCLDDPGVPPPPAACSLTQWTCPGATRAPVGFFLYYNPVW